MKIKEPDEALGIDEAVCCRWQETDEGGCSHGESTCCQKRKGNDVTFVSGIVRGNSKSYLTARLERDLPEVLEDLKAGIRIKDEKLPVMQEF